MRATPPMSDQAKRAYEAFEARYRRADEMPAPRWDSLEDREQEAWRAAASAAIDSTPFAFFINDVRYESESRCLTPTQMRRFMASHGALLPEGCSPPYFRGAFVDDVTGETLGEDVAIDLSRHNRFLQIPGATVHRPVD